MFMAGGTAIEQLFTGFVMMGMITAHDGARRQAQLLGRHTLPYPLPRGPMVEGHGLQARVALGFTAGLLGGPAALQGLPDVGIHRLGCFLLRCNRLRRRFLDRTVFFFPGSVAGLVGFGGAMGGVVFGLVVGYLLDRGFGYGVVFALVSTFHVVAFCVILLTVRTVRPMEAIT